MRMIDADALREDWLENGQNEYVYDTNAFLQSIDEQSTIEAEPVRHGEWVPVDGIDPCDEWECTACEERMTFMYELEADDMKVDFRYCPNCGAKMDGGEKE